ncbi:hypothetical protein LJ737_07165 [Hymenobacter sp. 15J16-1T3B]|uniref:hypothetical protein n=1 Tax=Hymenobacter sp. 15J16-1T3B TaxID=2886941 RepID=UPI001D128BCC|nr:hypothetical protein [Hymenobacter sp. 15J16-1T3B]MCC3157011.1 hypothetical protein [Hymenobacter sp. 15J16-1T3B]
MNLHLPLVGLLLLSAAGGPGREAPRAAVRRASGLSHWLTSNRRWRGTIGQLPVTLQLDSGHLGCRGEYAYDRLGRALDLTPKASEPRPPRVFEERAPDAFRVTGWLQLDAPAGPAITGTWRSSDGRRSVPLALRENYHDAAHYELETWQLRCPVSRPDATRPAGSWTHYEQSYLRVRLPGHPAAEQRLRRVLGPPVAASAVKNRLQTALLGKPAGYLREEALYVVCNTNYLLSVVSWHKELNPTANTIDEWTDVRNFDLRTGRELQLPDLLRPGYQPRLRQLLLGKLAAVWKTGGYGRVGADGKLPRSGFSVVPTGLQFSYDQRDDARLVWAGSVRTGRQIGVALSYRELLPLIRPDGPLAAMLRERGLAADAASAQELSRSAGK